MYEQCSFPFSGTLLTIRELLSKVSIFNTNTHSFLAYISCQAISNLEILHAFFDEYCKDLVFFLSLTYFIRKMF